MKPRLFFTRRLVVVLAVVVPASMSCSDGPHEPASDPSLAELVRELKRTNELLRGLQTALETKAVAPSSDTGSSARTQVEAQTDRSYKVFASIREDLSAIAKHLHAGNMAARRAPPAPKQDAALAEAATRYKANKNEAQRDHFLWDRQDVLDAYGCPDQSNTQDNGSSRWSYYLANDASSALVFEFDNGLVARSYVLER